MLFNKYLNLNNKASRVVLCDGRIIEGVIVGFFKGNRHSNDPYILKWHFMDVKDELSFGFDMFGNRIGEIISHKEIVEIYLYENDTKVICTDY